MLAFLVYVALGAAAVIFVLFTGFMVAAGYKRTVAAGVKLTRVRWLICLFWFAIGVLGDALYNVTIGTARFRQAPKFSRWHGVPIPELFSARVQRNVARKDWRGKLARDEAAFLNANMESHILLPPDDDDRLLGDTHL